ncbi:MAG TPA: patatin-like phospholipase family protein [Bacilli bacterium]|nr:patatin-like phospholipase family protein [Bacilli bacterium]
MKALVLGGGGAKGSYEVGVFKALRKLHMKFDIVTGVSIGSINGAFYVANEYKKCLKMWQKITTSDLFDVAIGSKMSKEDIKLLVKQMSSGGISFSNAYNFLKKNINEEKVRKSKIDYGLVTVSLTNKKPRFLTKEQIPYGKLVDYICASSICYPFVQAQDINDESFIDGGFYDGIPINLAIDMGATEILAVDLSVLAINKKPKDKNIKVDVIKMKDKTPLTLTFTKEYANKNIKYGYNDTMKHFNKLDGKFYTFRKNDLDKSYNELNKYFVEILKSTILNEPKNKIVNELFSIAKINKLFVKIKYNHDFKEEVEEALEHLGVLFDIPNENIYSIKKYNKLLIRKVKELNYIKINKNLKDKFLIGYMYNKYMKSENKEEIIKEMYNLSLIFPREYLCTVYLIAISKKHSLFLKADSIYDDILKELNVK